MSVDRRGRPDVLDGYGRPRTTGWTRESASPVIAATSSLVGSSATGAVRMCRASRKTVTVSQIS